jgi:predicted transcriptional regulator
MQERDRVNIMLVILGSSKDGADDDNDNIKKMTTNKMYAALFNDPRLKEYWDVLTQEGLLSYDSDTERFNTTEKGLRFLKAYKAMDYDMRREYNNIIDTFESKVS